MLSGVKFIPRDQVQDQDLDKDSVSKERKKSDSRRKEDKSPRNSSSDEDEQFGRIKGSRKKKWYSSDENSSSYTTESESDQDDKKRKRKGKKNKDKSSRRISSNEDERDEIKKGSRKKKRYSSDDDDSSFYTSESESDRDDKKRRRKGKKKKGRSRENKIKGDANSTSKKDIARKEMGLDWMLRSDSKRPAVSETNEILTEEAPVEESKKANPRELNPYLKDDGSGYPEESDGVNVAASKLLSSSLVGDGGASWRLKALKRAQEQAAREGRSFQEVVGERWGSLGELTASVASGAAAPARAHLRAIKSRQRRVAEDNSPDSESRKRRVAGDNSPDSEKPIQRDSKRDRHHEMKAPKVQDSLSWRKRKSQFVVAEGAEIVAAAASSLNKFANDGSFMRELVSKVSGNSEVNTPNEGNAEAVQNKMSANQLAAKAMQLRLKGKNDEADKLMEEAKVLNTKQANEDHAIRSRAEGSSRRYAIQRISTEQKKGEDDADMNLARNIMQNKQFKVHTQADDEYDFEEGPNRKNRKKQGGEDPKNIQNKMNANRFLTQKERCLFCLENPKRPMHLVVSIANFTYLMLPQLQPLVPGHCCILPIHHESATRTVDDNVWLEIRNFKKCLIMMFAKQDKEVVFLETVMGLAQQRRHCKIECIPLPKDIAKDAPLYFKKAIDEAEDEWSQHNAKKLIDTSQKGLRNSIPKDFPYFHVEFGLNKGFVHVIDDEKDFKSSLGLNVLRGMLHLPEEDMYRRQRYAALDVQKQAVANFSKEWKQFDWTTELH